MRVGQAGMGEGQDWAQLGQWPSFACTSWLDEPDAPLSTEQGPHTVAL